MSATPSILPDRWFYFCPDDTEALVGPLSMNEMRAKRLPPTTQVCNFEAKMVGTVQQNVPSSTTGSASQRSRSQRTSSVAPADVSNSWGSSRTVVYVLLLEELASETPTVSAATSTSKKPPASTTAATSKQPKTDSAKGSSAPAKKKARSSATKQPAKRLQRRYLYEGTRSGLKWH